MKHNFCSSNLLTKSNRTTLQSYKVEERTFGTHCTAKRAAVRKIQNLVIKELGIFLPERNLQRVRKFNKEEWYIDKFHSKTNRIWYSFCFWRKRMFVSPYWSVLAQNITQNPSSASEAASILCQPLVVCPRLQFFFLVID